MQFSQNVTVLGAQSLDFKDKDGKAIDMTMVHILEPLTQDNTCGAKSVKYAWGNKSNYLTIKNSHFPAQFVADFEITKRADGSASMKLLALTAVKA